MKKQIFTVVLALGCVAIGVLFPIFFPLFTKPAWLIFGGNVFDWANFAILAAAFVAWYVVAHLARWAIKEALPEELI